MRTARLANSDPRTVATGADVPPTVSDGSSDGHTNVEATLPSEGYGSACLAFDRSSGNTLGDAIGDGRRFRVIRPHAEGGLGAVFVAIDRELNREVALKQILEHRADEPVNRRRFMMEAKITGSLEHPGIVPVYSLGRDDAGRPYYAMRFIRGISLREAIAAFHNNEVVVKDPGQRSLALRKLLGRFLDVCDAIEYAHSRGVLHRDLKPSNVMLGSYGETLVVDWGLAKMAGQPSETSGSTEPVLTIESDSEEQLTAMGQRVGTPSYMSPEQAAQPGCGDRQDQRRLQPGGHALLVADRPIAILRGQSGRAPRHRGAGVFPAPEGPELGRSATRGDLPQGDGAEAGRPLWLGEGAGRGHPPLAGG